MIDLPALVRRLRDQQVTSLDEQVISAAIEAALVEVNTCIPGIIDAFDAAKQTARVKPALKKMQFPDDGSDPQWIELPLCLDVPVWFPSGNGFVLTFPVSRGDECLLFFSQRSIDNWYAKGGVQEQSDYRRHDWSDGVAFVGLRSQPNVIGDFDSQNVTLRSKDGNTQIAVMPDGTIRLQNQTGQAELGSDAFTVKAATIRLDGAVEITGSLTGDKGAVFAEDVQMAGTSGHGHVHPGVQSGSATTGPPQ